MGYHSGVSHLIRHARKGTFKTASESGQSNGICMSPSDDWGGRGAGFEEK